MIPKTKDVTSFTPEQIAILKDVLDKLARYSLNTNGDQLNGNLTIADGKNVVLDTATGTKIGTSTSQKIGFLGKTPVARQSAISDPSGGATVDAEARTAINSIIDVLQAFGFIA